MTSVRQKSRLTFTTELITFSQSWILNDVDPPTDLRKRCPAGDTIKFILLRMAEVAGELSSPAANKATNSGNPTTWLQTANRVLVAVGLALSTSSLMMRIYTKTRVMSNFWWDDSGLFLFHKLIYIFGPRINMRPRTSIHYHCLGKRNTGNCNQQDSFVLWIIQMFSVGTQATILCRSRFSSHGVPGAKNLAN